MSAMKKGGKKPKMGPWPRLQKFWDIRAALNFIGGGTGSGLLIIATVFILLGQTNITAIVAGAISISFGLFMVFLEIGKPWRSFNVFFHPQTSWMTREGIVVMPLFLCVALVIFYAGDPISKVASLLMSLFAMVFLYCQVRMINAAKGIPSWSHTDLKPFIFSSGLTEALGIAVCLPGLNTEKGLWLALTIMLLIRLTFWIVYTRNLNRDRAPEVTCAIFASLYIKVLTAHILAIVLLIAAWMTGMLVFSLLAGLLAATTGWYLKAIIIIRAAQTRGFSIPRTPVRGQGKSKLLESQR